MAAALSALASADPIPDRENLDELDAHFRRCRTLGLAYAKSTGVDEWEGLFHEAYMSVVRGKNYGRRAWAYLPHRIKSRACTAYSKQLRLSLTKQVITDRAEDTEATHGTGHEGCHLETVFATSLDQLENEESELLALRYFKNLSPGAIASVRGRGETPRQITMKLHRARMKVRAIAIRQMSAADRKRMKTSDLKRRVPSDDSSSRLQRTAVLPSLAR